MIVSDNIYPKVRLLEGPAYATPPTGEVAIYAKADGKVYAKDDAGIETQLAASDLTAIMAMLTSAVTYNFVTDANYSLTTADANSSVLKATDTGPAVLTVGRDLIFPGAFSPKLFTNSTARILTVKKSGQAGTAVAAGATVLVFSGAADVVVFSGGGGGAVSSVNGATGIVIVSAPIIIACSDESTALTVGLAKTTFRMPYAFTLTGVRASVSTAPTGAVLTVNIKEAGVSILSTKITIDATEKTSATAAIPPVISDTMLADDAEITIDIDTVGTTVAGAGLKVMLLGYPP